MYFVGIGHYVDHGNNDCCGQDFMAGTICSLALGHSGAHGTGCQVCGGDWYEQTCTCFPLCLDCRAQMRDASAPFCDDCCCDEQDELSGYWCQLQDGHQSLGVHACKFEDFTGSTTRILQRPDAPLTAEELAEVYKSLGVSPMQ